MAERNPGMTTTFDDVVTPLTLPVDLTGGAVPEAMVMDGIVRGQAIVGRTRSNDTMLGLKFDNGGRPVRVDLELSADEATEKWWRVRVPEEHREADLTLPRLVSIRAGQKARLVGAALVTQLAEDSPGLTRVAVSFDLDADEINPEGLLMIEVLGVSLGRDDLLDVRPALGLRYDAVRVTERGADEPRLPAQVSGGHTIKARTRHGWMSVVPGEGVTSVELEAVDAPLQLAALTKKNRYTRVGAKAMRKGTRIARSQARQAVSSVVNTSFSVPDGAVEVLDLQGRPVTEGVSVTRGPAGRLVVTFSESVTEPVLVHIDTKPQGRRSAGFLGATEWAIVGVH